VSVALAETPAFAEARYLGLAGGGARLHGASDPFFQTINLLLARDDEDRHG
jgi:hypothetical protein